MYQMGVLMMIRKLLVSAAALAAMTGGALAADLPNTKGPPMFAPPPPPVFSWTGVYIGGQVGYKWGQTSWSAITEPGGAFIAGEPTYSDQGVVGGGHIGYNYQISQFVIGLEGDVDGSSYSGSGLSTGGGFANTTRSDIDASIRARAGIAWDRVLFYVTGGGAYGAFRNTLQFPPGTFFSGADFGRIGWTGGGGVEYAVDPNWSVRVEYRYTDYGSYNFAATPFVGFREHETDNRVEAGFSYKFDMMAPPAPVVAKY
jgi:outer membrane immunogenic protein